VKKFLIVFVVCFLSLAARAQTLHCVVLTGGSLLCPNAAGDVLTDNGPGVDPNFQAGLNTSAVLQVEDLAFDGMKFTNGSGCIVVGVGCSLVPGQLQLSALSTIEIQVGSQFCLLNATGFSCNLQRLAPNVFSNFPTCLTSTEGMEAAVTDSTTGIWGATITGSGSNHVLAYCDGSNWTVAGK